MPSNGKRYAMAVALTEEDKDYQPAEAVGLIKKTATASFDETVELHLRTGADPRHADQQVRGVTVLPHGIGKQVRIVVFTQGEAMATAEEAGADHVGNDDLIKQIEDGWTDFDVSIATPDMMGKIGRLGRVLGRRGLMPNPRTGTVVQPDNIAKAVSDAKKGRVEYRLDREAIIHVVIGKSSFDESQLLDNLTALMDTIIRARPGGVKGQFVRSAFLTTTMGPSVRLDVATVSALKVE
ncbi:MAG: 50S ribosomal protein L1 [SAR202 cluster bacterium]|nr:50S ribosomal protein L1 [SAR202 cluster bacterium]